MATVEKTMPADWSKLCSEEGRASDRDSRGEPQEVFSPWEGATLSDGPIAVILLDTLASTGPPDGSIAVSAASSADETVVVGSDQLPLFLTHHANRHLVCHDAGRLHWALVDILSAKGETSSLSQLWEFSKDCRIHDVMLMDQRLRMIAEGVNPLPRTLPQLLRIYVDKSINPSDPNVSNLSQLLRLYEYLRRKIDALSKIGGTELTACFGPLGLGVDVQGAIAAEAASRRGLCVDHPALAAFKHECEENFRQNSSILHRSQAARRELRWDGDVIKRDREGRVDVKTKRLRGWLQPIFEAFVNLHGAPFSQPLDDSGQLSTRLSHWGMLPSCHKDLQAWQNLTTASFMQSTLSEGDAECHPRFAVVPRLETLRPDVSGIHRLGGRIFLPRSGCIFVVATLQDLELRCYAAICSARYHPPATSS